MFMTLCFPHKNRLCLLSDQEMAASPSSQAFQPHQLLPVTRGFHLQGLSRRTEPGSRLQNKQQSGLGPRRKAAASGARILHQFSFLLAGFSSQILGSSLPAWFLTARHAQSPGCAFSRVRPPSVFSAHGHSRIPKC